jgi:hypothetical protein
VNFELLIASSITFHLLIYALLPKSCIGGRPEQSLALRKSYVISTLHSIIVVCGTLCWLLLYGFVDFTSPASESSSLLVTASAKNLMQFPLAYSIGYFCFDLMLILFVPSVFSVSSLLHHIIIGTALYLGNITGIGQPFHFLGYLEESSTIFLNCRYLSNSESNRKRYEILFALFFFASRWILGGIVYFKFLLNYGSSTNFIYSRATLHPSFIDSWHFQCVLYTLSKFLNIFWGLTVIRMILKSAKKSTATIEPTKKGEKLTKQS